MAPPVHSQPLLPGAKQKRPRAADRLWFKGDTVVSIFKIKHPKFISIQQCSLA